MTSYDPLAEVNQQYKVSAQRHRQANPTNDPRLRPQLWMAAFDPVEILDKARKAEMDTNDSRFR